MIYNGVYKISKSDIPFKLTIMIIGNEAHFVDGGTLDKKFIGSWQIEPFPPDLKNSKLVQLIKSAVEKGIAIMTICKAIGYVNATKIEQIRSILKAKEE